MKSYGQLCAVAQALDVVGDRWSLLVVRELLDGPRRWTDLRSGLPGVAKNLLADRLRDLEAAGVLTREADRYALTPRGAALEPVLTALLHWGAPLVADAPPDAHARGDWVRMACRAVPHAELLEGDDDHARVRLGDVVVEGTPAEVLRAMAATAPR